MRLLTVGDVTVDLFLALPDLPERGGDAHTDQVFLRAGGSAANVAVVATALGLPAALVGAVGQDPMGEWAIEALRASGVEISLLQRRPEAPTTLIVIMVSPDGERTMISGRGASRFAVLEERARSLARQAAFFHLSGYTLLEESPLFWTAMALLEEARQAGCFCSLDPGPPAARMAREAVFRALPLIDVLLLGEAEAEDLFGPNPTLAFEPADRPRWVLVKQGEHGCRLLGREGEDLSIPAFRIQTVDTTGAGDAFDAGFLTGLARGLRPTAAALLGNAAGAIACTTWGVIGAFPGRPAVRRLLENALADPAWDRWRSALEEALALAQRAPLSDRAGCP
ncbi:MAG: carbohydrate kinase family protein [Thermoflexus sp.]|uniref:carbohydrate kinase family protein n=1 Tax=Thermoflexus sp. TaxID=1969742 RepID=UPI0025DFE223|nr:carbohydrate kinase family protein [Thermoflexus sp.]MCS6962900.1 carbohydrate kinase family protein [Thermoflexus sp.]MDW8183922.1 carbohydrate kinase family protein [Anaerolineae bacterium]